MAKPIKETPILTGTDASSFRKQNEKIEKISTSERARIKKSYNKLNSIAQF